jgi:hypothetical protein
MRPTSVCLLVCLALATTSVALDLGPYLGARPVEDVFYYYAPDLRSALDVGLAAEQPIGSAVVFRARLGYTAGSVIWTDSTLEETRYEAGGLAAHVGLAARISIVDDRLAVLAGLGVDFSNLSLKGEYGDDRIRITQNSFHEGPLAGVSLTMTSRLSLVADYSVPLLTQKFEAWRFGSMLGPYKRSASMYGNVQPHANLALMISL